MEIIFYLRILSLWRSVINKIPEYNDLNFSSNCLISPLRRYFIWASIEPFFFQLSPYLLNLSSCSFKKLRFP